MSFDLEEGRDAVGDLPAAPPPVRGGGGRPSLHGLDRELSSRGLAPSSPPRGPTAPTASNQRGFRRGGSNVSDGSRDGNASNGNGSSGLRANYSDYLKAQRAMQSRRNLGGGAANNRANLAAAMQDLPVEGEGGVGNGATNGSAEDNDATAGSNTEQPVQLNMTALTAVAKLRRRSAASKSEREQKMMRVLATHGKRGSCANLMGEPDLATDWNGIFDKLGECDEDGHFEHGGHGDELIPWYAPPLQRQRWGEDTQLPHVNWGDLFFDLFYVAMAFNLGVMLVSALNSEDWLRGIIYYVGAFGPLWTTWEVDMFYSSRYTVVDYAHRIFQVVRYLFVSMAVCHVKPMELQGDPKSLETLLFTAAIMCEGMMALALSFELYFRAEGDRETIKNHTFVKIKCQHTPTLLVYIAAFTAAVVNYYRPDGEEGDSSGGKERLLASDPSVYEASNAYESATASEPLWQISDFPLTLTAVAYLGNAAVTGLRKLLITSGKHGDIRDRYVPNNVDYIIHRYGEWILLMIGEGILSLLIVETVETADYYIITTFGILTIIFVQILKFESEPSHADGHALWRSLHNGMCYSYLMQLLSLALITFGVTYKVFLKAVLKEEQKKEAEGYAGEKTSRMLASSSSVSDEASAGLFAYSLFVVLISMELMSLTHGGIQDAFEHLVKRKDGQRNGSTARGLGLVVEAGFKNLYWPVVIILLFKLAILGFCVTLNLWTADPATLTLCGCAIVLLLSATRILNFFFIHQREAIQRVTETVRKATIVVSNAGEKLVDKRSSIFSITPRQSLAENDDDEPLMTKSNHSTRSLPSKSNHSTDSSRVETKSGPRLRRHESEQVAADADLAGGINSSFDGIVVADLNGVITQVNDTAVTLFDYANKREMIGKNLSILVGGGDGLHHDAWVKAFKSRVTTNDNPQHKVLGRQRMLHGRKADGTEFPCIIGIKMVSNNKRVAGYIRDMTGVANPIREKGRMSVTMDAQEAVEKAVSDHSFDAIIAVDGRGHIQRLNKAALAEFGYAKSELLGKNLSMLIAGIKAEHLLEEEGQKLVRPTRKDGSEFQAILAVRSILAPSKVKSASTVHACYIRNIDSIQGIKARKDE